MGPYSRPSVSQSYVLECADGKWIALHMSSPEKFWQGLATAIEQPDLFEDPRFATREARIEHQEELIELLGERSSSAARATTGAARLEADDVPHAPMYDDQPRRRTTRRRSTCSSSPRTEHPRMGAFRTVRSPVSFDGERALDVTAPPTARRARRSAHDGWDGPGSAGARQSD